MTEKKTDLQEEIRRVEWDITELCGSIERIAWYVKDGRTLSGDKKDSEELLSSLNKAFEKLWQLDAVARQLDELQKKGPLLASEVAAEQEKGAAYGYDAKGNRVSLGASPSRLKPEEVTSDQELEQVARQAIRAEQIYQKVAAELKAAQSTSEASCSDSSVLQR